MTYGEFKELGFPGIMPMRVPYGESEIKLIRNDKSRRSRIEGLSN